ncbi:hypothetical protein JTE88_04845 [Arcanobacterium phocisimile]|uniref:Tetratricopeptide repeat-containing protein n=1 Tax=Arcanobacterium phocisimile TaxID=1302235 RepID=A0ABX7IFX4_9ACTO|nr:hypothetical protein [Arcanobacterium phocisimile]QRV01449.1 hypothetical protein JTE88_04845 [Arcanobacterium phocisimile]
MSDYRNINDRRASRANDSSGWQSSSRPFARDSRRDDDRGGRRWDNDRRGGRDERRDDRGPRRWDNDRRDSRRDDDRGGRRWDNDRRGGRDERRDDRGPRRWDNDRRDSRRDDDRGGRRWDNNQDSHNAEDVRSQEPDSRQLLDEIPESITSQSLDADVRRRLLGLTKENGERVARHLAYAGEMMDIDPEVAYTHAHAAYMRAARVDVVREALGLTAYVTGRYAEALRELRTYRRMSDDYSHVPIEADSERGLGRPEKALRFIEDIPLARLDAEAKIELAIVTSGARAETGDIEGGLSVLQRILVENLDDGVAARVQLTKADRLEELGRTDEAEELRQEWQAMLDDGNDFSMMVDLDEVLDDLPEEDLDLDSEFADEHDDFAELRENDEDEAEDFEEDFADADFDDDELDGDFDDEDLAGEPAADEEFDGAFEELFGVEDVDD